MANLTQFRETGVCGCVYILYKYNVCLSDTKLCGVESGYTPAKGTTHGPVCQHASMSACVFECVCDAVRPYKAVGLVQSYNTEGKNGKEQRESAKRRIK